MKKRCARNAGPIVAPPELTSAEIVVNGRRLVVFSFPRDSRRAATDPLTVAEREVLVLLLAGMSNAAMASARRTAARTVANQVASIFRKLGVASRRELLVRGERAVCA